MRLRNSPSKLFALLMAIILAVHGATMVLTQFAIPHQGEFWFHIGADVILFAAIFAPILWALMIRPLQDALDHEHRLAGAVLETAAEGVITIDEHGTIRSYNPAAERIFGYSAAETLGRNVSMLMPEAERAQHDNFLRRYLETGESRLIGAKTVVVGRRKNGDNFAMELAVSETHTRKGRIFTGIIHDISGHLAIEDALYKSNQLFERIFSNLPTLVAYLDAHCHFIQVNRAYAHAHGHDPDYFVGKDHFQLYPDAEDEAIFRRVADTGEPYIAYAKPFAYPDQPEKGTTYRDVGLYPVKNTRGQVEGLLLVLLDVTERERAVQQRVQAEARFRTLFDNANDAIFIHEPGGQFIEANQTACERLGYGRDELLALSPAQINAPETAASIPQRQQELESNEAGILFEAVHLTRAGTRIPVEVHARLIRYDHRQAVLSVARDISQRKAFEAALRTGEQARKALLNATQESALLVDTDGKALAVNDIAAQRFHTAPDELLGRQIFGLLSAEFSGTCRDWVREVVRSAKPHTYQHEREGVQYETSLYPVLDDQGQVASIAVYAQDITEQKQREGLDNMLEEIDQMSLSGMRLDFMFAAICTRLTQIFRLPLAWVGEKKPDGSINILAHGGPATGLMDAVQRIGVRWDDTPSGHGLVGRTIRSGKPHTLKTHDPSYRPWAEAARKHGIQSLMVLPIVLRGEIYGTLAIYSEQPDAFRHPAVAHRHEGIASRIGMALEMALEQQQVHLLSTALASASNAVFIADREGRIEWVNQAFCTLSGYAAQEVLGRNPRFLKSGQHDSAYYRDIWGTILAGRTWSGETVERHKGGSFYTVRQTITPILDSTGEITHFITVHEDITAQKLAAERMAHMAQYDSLTDLPNRHLFYDRLHHATQMAKRGGHTLALLFLDLDRFKGVNDTLGHAIGDLLLQAVAARLRACTRESDTVARLAGDEFTVILDKVGDREDAGLVADKIVTAIAKPYHLDGHEAHIGTSIGIALYPQNATTVDGLVKAADAAMYLAKTESRNTYRFCESGPEGSGPLPTA